MKPKLYPSATVIANGYSVELDPGYQWLCESMWQTTAFFNNRGVWPTKEEAEKALAVYRAGTAAPGYRS